MLMDIVLTKAFAEWLAAFEVVLSDRHVNEDEQYVARPYLKNKLDDTVIHVNEGGSYYVQVSGNDGQFDTMAEAAVFLWLYHAKHSYMLTSEG